MRTPENHRTKERLSKGIGWIFLLAATGGGLTSMPAHAGPYILAGTDADDHGSATATTNVDGWLFMQKALENIAASSSLTTPNKVVLSLGSNAGSKAGQAAESAFSKSILASTGWSFLQVSNLTNASFASSIGGAGIMMLDSGDNIAGGLTASEESVLAANATAINSFVGGGGGLFSQANDYGWLSSLLPNLTVNSFSDTGLTLTAAGAAAFPGLTNGDLSAGPYHEYFTNTGAISTLATGLSGRINVVIGSAGGSITVPTSPLPAVPEPESVALMFVGLGLVGAVVRRRRT